MKTRILTGVIAAILFLFVLLQPYTIILNVVVGALCALATYELLNTTQFCPSKIIQWISMIFAFTVSFWGLIFKTTNSLYIIAIEILVYVIIIGVVQVFRFDDQPITSSIFAVAMTLWSSFAISSIAYLRSIDGHGLFLTVLLLLICWMSDTGAYFVGVLFGSHKLCPEISPKKTIEGFIGGIVVSVAICTLVTYLYNFAWNTYYTKISLVSIIIISCLGSILSVFGDLTASLLKRLCEIKDYGNLFPGHGGVMDRFDSFLFTAPLFFLYILAFNNLIFISTIACLP